MTAEAVLRRFLAAMRIPLDDEVVHGLCWLGEELLRWNQRVNLTAITRPEEVVEKHLVDSLTLLDEIDPAGRLLDLGSGAGFPGIPLRLARPELRVVSVDAVQKKIAFQRHAVRTLGLSGFTPWHGRAENLPTQPGYAGGFDRVVSRAFASLEDFARLALPCLTHDGRIVAMKGQAGEQELQAAAPFLRELGLECHHCCRLSLPAGGGERCLIVLERR